MNTNDLRDSDSLSKRVRRSNAEIKKSIFESVYQIVKDKGFPALSINQIVIQSKVSPIIINKRFKDLDDIIEQFIGRWDYWIDLFNDRDNEAPSKESYQKTLESVLDVVWKKKPIQQILAWEMIEDSPLLDPMIEEREREVKKMMARYEDMFKDSEYDVRLLSAILLSSVYYLSGYKKKESFCGLSLKGNLGNLKVLEGMNQIIELVFNDVDKTKEKQIAKRMLESGDSAEKVAKITGLSIEVVTAL